MVTKAAAKKSTSRPVRKAAPRKPAAEPIVEPDPESEYQPVMPQINANAVMLASYRRHGGSERGVLLEALAQAEALVTERNAFIQANAERLGLKIQQTD